MTSAAYTGTLNAAGERHGHGTYAYSNKFYSYEGQWNNGLKHGRGKLSMADGTMHYEGDFADGEITGNGTRLRANGERYVGAFVDGEMHGVGRLERRDGKVYTGSFAMNRFHGSGRLEAERDSAICYSGAWARGRRHGSGTEVFRDGSSYDGDWCDGKRHGVGTYSCGLLSRIGEWVNDAERLVPSKLVITAPAGSTGDDADAVKVGRGARLFVVEIAVCAEVGDDAPPAGGTPTAAAAAGGDRDALVSKGASRDASGAAAAAAAVNPLDATHFRCVAGETGRVVRCELVPAEAAAAAVVVAAAEGKEGGVDETKPAAEVVEATVVVENGRAVIAGLVIPHKIESGLWTLTIEDVSESDVRHLTGASLSISIE